MSGPFIIVLAILGGSVLLYLYWRVCLASGTRFYGPILAYHNIDNGINLTITHTPPARFKRDLSHVKQLGYTAVGLDRLLEQDHQAARHKEFGLIFDDSYANIHGPALDHLQSLGFTATFFVISAYVGKLNRWDVSIKKQRHMDRAQIQDVLDRGFAIGSHTVTHRDLTLLPQTELEAELTDSKKQLEDMFGREIKYLSYPFGRYNRRVMETARSSGYKAGFTINNPHGYDGNRMCVPTLGIYSIDALRNVVSKATGDRFFWVEQVKGKIINRFAGGTILVKGKTVHG